MPLTSKPLAFLLLGISLGVLGCGQAEVIGGVSGAVTFNGKPVRKGMIVFSNPQKGITISAPLGEGGLYKVETAKGYGIPVGTYLVTVVPPVPQVTTAWPAKPPPPATFPDIPERYRDLKTSDLTVTVTAAGVVYNVDMKS